MRIIRFLIFYAMVSLLGLIAAVFLALNHYTVQLDVIAAQYSVSLAWVIVGAAAFGFMMALLALAPGRIAAGLYARALARDVRELGYDISDLEHELDKQDDLRADLLGQHEMLLERHERLLAHHQALITDHSRLVVERDQARIQLDALRIARPTASAAHSLGAATALRLLPPANPAPIPRPVTPVPAAHAATSVAEDEARAEPTEPPEPHPITPVPESAAEPQAPVTSLAASPAPSPAEPPDSELRSVPVTSTSLATATASAPGTPPASESPAPKRVKLPKPPKPPKAPKLSKQPKSIPSGLRRTWSRLQTSARRTWRSAGGALGRLGLNISAAWDKVGTQIITQIAAQRASLQRLRQRVASSHLASENDTQSETSIPLLDEAE